MSRFLLLLFTTWLLVGIAATESIQAAVVYSQTTPDEPIAAFGSEDTSGFQKIADNFAFTTQESTTVRSLRIIGGYIARGGSTQTLPLDTLPNDNFRIAFLEGDGGSPDSLIGAGDFGIGSTVIRTPTNGLLLNGVAVPVEFVVDLGNGITFNTNTEYWISITNNLGPDFGWSWARGTGTLDANIASTNEEITSGAWDVFSNGGMWFELNNQNIPEPSTQAIFLVVAAIFLARKRHLC